MKVDSAIALVTDAVVYKPGWTFEASKSTRFEAAINVCMASDSYQSEREDAPEGYPNAIRPRASFCIHVGEMHSEDELWRALIEKIIEYEVHEAREFLRIKPTMWAPFHPHRIDGSKRWWGGDMHGVEADVKYGMV